MKKNVGTVDMVIRVIIGIVIASFGIVYKNWWGLIAIIPILTALMNYCPLYSPFGFNTSSSKDGKK